MKFTDKARGWLAAGAIAVGTMGAQGCGTEGQTENTNNGVAAEGSGGWERQDPDPATFRAATDTRAQALEACDNFINTIQYNIIDAYGEIANVDHFRHLNQLTNDCVTFFSKVNLDNECSESIGSPCSDATEGSATTITPQRGHVPVDSTCLEFSQRVIDDLIETGRPTEEQLVEGNTFTIACSNVMNDIRVSADEIESEQEAERRERENAEGSGDEGSGSEGSGN